MGEEKEEKEKESPKEKVREKEKDKERDREREKEKEKEKDRHTLRISNLSRNVNEDHLREIFGNYGKIKEASLVIDKDVGIPTGFATVEFVSDHDAERAISHFN